MTEASKKIEPQYSSMSNRLVVEVFRKSYQTSKFVRVLLLANIFVSSIVFISVLNSWKYSWINERISMHKCIESELTGNHNGHNHTLAEEQAIKDYINERDYLGKEDNVREIIKHYEQVRIDHVVMQRIPVLGVSYDINDISFVGGGIIVLAFFALCYSQALRYTHLHTAFEVIDQLDKGRKKIGQELIRMDQVLTVFQGTTTQEGKPVRKKYLEFMGRIPKYLYFTPIIALEIIVVHDFVTRKIAEKLLNSPGKATFLLIVSVVYTVVMIAMTWYSQRLIKDTDRMWEGYFSKWKKEEEQEAVALAKRNKPGN